jgi:hypothetical protein
MDGGDGLGELHGDRLIRLVLEEHIPLERILHDHGGFEFTRVESLEKFHGPCRRIVSQLLDGAFHCPGQTHGQGNGSATRDQSQAAGKS